MAAHCAPIWTSTNKATHWQTRLTTTTKTDLRTSALNNCQNTIGGVTYANLCENNVPGSGKDKNEQQHMTTFTLGLGVNGTVTYESGYESAPDIKSVTQYIDILNGTANWAKIVDWDCQNNCPPQIDDLWHAAVNGRGTYFSASNPSSVEAGLREALAGVSARLGTGAAVATSNLELVAGSNAVYLAQYRTGVWDGELIALAIDPMSGAINTTTPFVVCAKRARQASGSAHQQRRWPQHFLLQQQHPAA
jgi:type IV pilus assembly protein PilY1